MVTTLEFHCYEMRAYLLLDVGNGLNEWEIIEGFDAEIKGVKNLVCPEIFVLFTWESF